MKTASRIILVLVIAILLLVGGASWYAYNDRPERPVLAGATPAAAVVVGAGGLPALNAELAATGITRFNIVGGSGEMDISASGDDKIHVSLELRQQQKSILFFYHWLSNDTTRDILSATLEQARHGDTLELALVYPSGQDRSDIQERWKVLLPPRLMVDASMYAGELKITGMQNGVKSALTAGEMSLQGIGGMVEASVRYGRLHVISASDDPGMLNVTADHGLAVMSLGGKYYGPPEQPGLWNHIHLIGNSVVQREKGRDNMDLSVNYGEADLRVGPLGDFKDYHDAFTAD